MVHKYAGNKDFEVLYTDIVNQGTRRGDVTHVMYIPGKKHNAVCHKMGKYPRLDSNQGTRLRRPALYPLSYGGF